MIRKALVLFITFIFAILLLVEPLQANGDAGRVGVCIPAEEKGAFQASQATGDFVIDYGTFLWTVMPNQDLDQLDSAGVDYQAVPNPYLLTLGGQTFDPLDTTPGFSPAWGASSSQADEPGLHLVQFQGPTKAEWLRSIKADGFDVLQYIHPFTYVVWGESSRIKASTQKEFMRWSGDFLPAYAVQPQNRNLNTTSIPVRMMFYPSTNLADITQAVRAWGASEISAVSGADPTFGLLGFTIPGDQLQAIASLPGVYSVQPVPQDGGDRGEMSNQVNAGNIHASNLAFPGYLNWLRRLQLSGDGVTIANVDSGVDQNHPDLANRMVACLGDTCGGDATSDHGTHTAGIMAGDGSSGEQDSYGYLRGLGMAPAANLMEQVYSPTYTEPEGMLTLMAESYKNGAVISGNSWGPSSTPQGYDADTRLVDVGVRDADPYTPGNQPLSYILSLMNGNGGTSTQGTPDEAKNIFTIGSSEMQTSAGEQKLNINDLSQNTAHGPALDGRIIPHMVAPGYLVDSTLPGGTYGLKGGTSMSSPHVTGAVALFYEKYRRLFGDDPSPALVKAAFLPVANDLAGSLDADDNLLGHPFDAKQGWGRLNAKDVLDPSGAVYYYDAPVILDDTGDQWQISLDIEASIAGIRAMLVWTDAPGHGLGGETDAWVNDLDLSLSVGGDTYYGNYFGSSGFSSLGGTPDGMNNTEGIFLSNPEGGSYTFTVTASQIADDGVPGFGDETDQDFALVIYVHGNDYYFPLIYR